MYGAPLKIASKKRKSKKATSEATEGEAYEPKPKKAKKEITDLQVNEVGSAMPTIQEEVKYLAPIKVLDKRTRGSKFVGSSGSIPAQPKIQKKKITLVRKLKESQYVLEEESEIEAATELVTREVRNKKVVDALQQAMQIGREIEVPASSLVRENVGEDA